jgi:hypothetical protein
VIGDCEESWKEINRQRVNIPGGRERERDQDVDRDEDLDGIVYKYPVFED